MHALEEKNNLTNELTATRKKLEDLANIKVDIFFDSPVLFELHCRLP